MQKFRNLIGRTWNECLTHRPKTEKSIKAAKPGAILHDAWNQREQKQVTPRIWIIQAGLIWDALEGPTQAVALPSSESIECSAAGTWIPGAAATAPERRTSATASTATCPLLGHPSNYACREASKHSHQYFYLLEGKGVEKFSVRS